MDICFVLIEPRRPQNVGAAARALKTMGFGDLRLVGPAVQTRKDARILAHGALDVLRAATNYTSLAAAIGDCDLVVGTTAKARHQRRYHHSPEQLGAILESRHAHVRRTAVLFGREDRGLSNAEIAHCDLLSQIALARPQPSLNLAQAVMLYAYTLSRLPASPAAESGAPDQAQHLRQRLGDLLSRCGIAPEEKAQRWAMERLAQAADADIRFLHFICAKIEQLICGEVDTSDRQ